MDEYPAFSLDLGIPLLVTLGIAPETSYESGLEPGLKEQAILLRSEVPAVDSELARSLLRYIQGKDAAELPWNGRDEKRAYRFRVRAAERVGCPRPVPRPFVLARVLTVAYRPSCCRPAKLSYRRTSRRQRPPPSYTHPSLP